MVSHRRDVFEYFGDVFHIASMLLLLRKLWSKRSCLGISLHTQVMYAIVFISRYIVILFSLFSQPLYYTFMRVLFISVTLMTIYLMRYKRPICHTYDKNADNFPWIQYNLLPALGMALLSTLWRKYFTPSRKFLSILLKHISYWVEAVAIYPQLDLLQRMHEVENITAEYVVSMGVYRLCYLINWIACVVSPRPVDVDRNLSMFCAFIQVLLYCEVFFYYVKANYYGENMCLPFTAAVSA